jgi:hypothetical protein
MVPMQAMAWATTGWAYVTSGAETRYWLRAAGFGLSDVAAAGFQGVGAILGGCVEVELYGNPVRMWLPLYIPALLAAAGIAIGEARGKPTARRARARGSTPIHLWQSALATGLILGLVAVVGVLLVPMTPGRSPFGAIAANPLATVIGGLVIGTLGAAIGQAWASGRFDTRTLGWPVSESARLRIDIWTVATHNLLLAAATLLFACLVLAVVAPRWEPAAVLVGATIVAFAVGMASLGPLHQGPGLLDEQAEVSWVGTWVGQPMGVIMVVTITLGVLITALIAASARLKASSGIRRRTAPDLHVPLPPGPPPAPAPAGGLRDGAWDVLDDYVKAALLGPVEMPVPAAATRPVRPKWPWWRLPLVYTFGGAVVVAGSVVVMIGGPWAGPTGATALFISPLFVPISTLWGVGVDLLTRFVAPRLLPHLPWRLAGAIDRTAALVADRPTPVDRDPRSAS